MKRITFKPLRGFQVKVTLAFIFCMLLSGTLSNFLIYKYTLNSQFNDLRDKLKIIAQTAALLVDPDKLIQIPLNKKGIQTENFKVIAEKLNKVRSVNPQIKYIYTLAKTEEEGVWQFIVDPSGYTPEDIEQGLTSYPGDKYDASRFPEMLKAFDGPSADTKLEIDEWGATLSGYAPIINQAGQAIAMLGVDIMADSVYNLRKRVHNRAMLVFIVGIMLSVVLGMIISWRITDRIERLVEGTHHLANGELEYQVSIKGHDEIGELAQSFNTMAKSLSKSQNKMRDYFYRAMQALIRILEAKDPYTHGHSDRVVEYAEKIGQKMKLSPERIELLKRAAELHDIGKLSIQKNILNKKTRLTEEEWEIIRNHPIIGEHILKPVAFDEQLLTIVRSHHERYDGKGYPDKIEGKKMDICTQIISVADAYDAMVSVRAYRPAMEVAEAIERLNESKGSQFNPQVVEALIEIIRED
ncbi:MAG: HD domain-containing protein [Candidatus Omnitrophica bacterium]|nr:HD domain-containing protein [Candidatus Omnitrophota bacterium]